VRASPLFGVYNISKKETYMIKKINILCNTCGKEIEKLASEINRQKKRGRTKFYCDLKCAGKSNCSHLEKYVDDKSIKRIQQYKKQKDEYSSFRYHLNIAKRRSEKYDRDFNLDLNFLKDLWIKQGGKCAVTKLPLNIKYIHTKKQRTDKSPYQASLDRIDNNKGYTKDNVRFVSYMFNIARNNFTDEEVLDFCKCVVNNIE
jgi:hypothetical protein